MENEDNVNTKGNVRKTSHLNRIRGMIIGVEKQ